MIIYMWVYCVYVSFYAENLRATSYLVFINIYNVWVTDRKNKFLIFGLLGLQNPFADQLT